jgi:hypothetical protein
MDTSPPKPYPDMRTWQEPECQFFHLSAMFDPMWGQPMKKMLHRDDVLLFFEKTVSAVP